MRVTGTVACPVCDELVAVEGELHAVVLGSSVPDITFDWSPLEAHICARHGIEAAHAWRPRPDAR